MMQVTTANVWMPAPSRCLAHGEAEEARDGRGGNVGMDGEDRTPEGLRRRATKLRRVANSITDPELAAHLLALAAEYDVQAELAQNVDLLRKMAGHGG